MCNFTTIHDNSSHFPSRMSNAELFGIFKKAAKLTKDPCNGCRTVVSQRHFALSPRYLGRLKKGAMETLESEIGHYSESLGGVPLAYCNLQLLQQTGNILDDQPFIHFNVSFKAVIFQPAIGSILKCVVNEFAADHVSCLVHNWFNLSLPLRGTDAQERLPKGSKVMTKVTKIQAKNGILAIQATPTEERFSDLQLVDPLTEEQSDEDEAIAMEVDGAVSMKVKHDSGFGSDPDSSIGLPLESASDEGENVGSKKKKKKRKDEEEVDGVAKEEPNLDVVFDKGLVEMTEEPGGEGKKKKKKKKKDKIKEKEMEDSPERFSVKQELEGFTEERADINGAGDGSNIEQPIKKKKKKKRKSGVDSDSSEHESITIKKEEADSEESIPDVNLSHKKSKKKRKERESKGAGIDIAEEEVKRIGNLMIKDEIESDSEQSPQTKVKSKKRKHKDGSHHAPETTATREEPNNDKEKLKHLKRKHSDMSVKVNGDGDHNERTTQIEVYGTDEDTDSAPPKKKKKKKKHIKEEVV